MNESLYGKMLYGKNLYSKYRRTDMAAISAILLSTAGRIYPSRPLAADAIISCIGQASWVRKLPFDASADILLYSYAGVTVTGLRQLAGSALVSVNAIGNVAYRANIRGDAGITIGSFASAEVYLGPYWIEKPDDDEFWTPNEPETEIWVNRPKDIDFWIPRGPETEIWINRPRDYEIWSEVPKNG